MKIALSLLLLLHALIHVLGFVKAFGLAELKDFKEPLTKSIGLIWLVTTVNMLGFAIAYYLSLPGLNFFGWFAVILSQTLIFYYWKVAKAGTLGNLIALYILLWG